MTAVLFCCRNTVSIDQRGETHFVADRKLMPVELVWRGNQELLDSGTKREIQILEESIETLQKRLNGLKARLARSYN